MRERAHAKGLSHGYLEGYDDEEEEEGVSLSAIKNKYKSGSGKKGKSHEISVSSWDFSGGHLLAVVEVDTYLLSEIVK